MLLSGAVTGPKLSKTLKHHTLLHPLRSDRSYVVFEHGSLFDLASSFEFWTKLVPEHDIRTLLNNVAIELRRKTYDAKRLDQLREEARRQAWKYMHTSKENWSASILVLMAFLSAGTPLECKEKEDDESVTAELAK